MKTICNLDTIYQQMPFIENMNLMKLDCVIFMFYQNYYFYFFKASEERKSDDDNNFKISWGTYYTRKTKLPIVVLNKQNETF